MYANIALLVKWADFASRDPRYSMNREYIFFCVTRFKDALNVSLFLIVLSLSHTLSLSLSLKYTHIYTLECSKICRRKCHSIIISITQCSQ